MREFVRPFAATLSIACLAASMAMLSSSDVLAQAKQAPPKQMAPAPQAAPPQEAPAKKNGFASYDEYNDVVANISMVLGGFDPATKKYVGSDAAIKAQMTQVQADKKMSPKDKKEALADLNEALKSPAPPIENKGNIDLVAKYYDKLADALGDDQQ